MTTATDVRKLWADDVVQAHQVAHAFRAGVLWGVGAVEYARTDGATIQDPDGVDLCMPGAYTGSAHEDAAFRDGYRDGIENTHGPID